MQTKPFKSLGSYLGAIILPLIFLIIFYIETTKVSYYGMAILPAIIVSIILIPIGFLLGWLIHFLIKRFKLKNLFWVIPLIIAVILLFFLATGTSTKPSCGDGICQEQEIQEGASLCDIDCQEQCIIKTSGIDDIEGECSVGWEGTYLNLINNGIIDSNYLKETNEIDFLHPEIQKLAKSLKKETIKETVKSVGEWTYQNIEYDVTDKFFDCRSTKSSKILERKSGVCSTMSKLNIALLRANGIPAYSITGCWKFNEACELIQTFFPELKGKFIEIQIDETGHAPTYGYLHNWVIVPLYQDGVTEELILESTTGTLHKLRCVNYAEYYINPSDSLVCGLDQFDPKVDECKAW